MDWDLVLKVAPVVVASGAAWAAFSARNAAWANAKRAERAEQRAVEADEAPRRLGVRVSTIHDDNVDRTPRRHAKIFLKPPKNGDYCEVIGCKVEMMTGQRYELRWSGSRASAKIGESVSIIPRVTLVDSEQQFNITIDRMPLVDTPATITFTGVKQDSARTPFTAVAIVPPASKAAPETVFD